MFTRDDFLGEVTVRLTDFGDGRIQDRWFTLEKEPEKKKKDKTPGEVHLKIQFTGPNVVVPEEAEKPHPTPATTNNNNNTPSNSPSIKNTTTTTTNNTPQKVEPPKPAPEKPAAPTRAVKIEDKYELGKVLGR